jgi:hypothetical protein
VQVWHRHERRIRPTPGADPHGVSRPMGQSGGYNRTISYLGRYASVVFAEIPVLASLLSNANPNAKPVTLILALQVFFAVSRYLNQSFST